MRATIVSLVLLALLGTAAPLSAQQHPSPCPVAPPAASDTVARRPDLVISASAQIRELRFRSQPQADLELTGCPSLDSVRVERRNLPRPVRPGETYRDVDVRLQATGYLNVQCLLASETGGAAAPAESLRAQLSRALAALCAAGAADSVPPARRPRR